MLILGIDTSTKNASTAVTDFDSNGGKVLCEMQAHSKVSHSENLMPMVDYTLKCAGVLLNDIDLFAVSQGPGSFTGIRIGIAAVKGLAFTGFDINNNENKNCAGISSLYSLAYNLYKSGESKSDILILPAIDARRKQIYNAIFQNLEYIKNDRIITISELENELNSEFTDRKIAFIGDGAEMCYNEINFAGKVQVPEIIKKPSATSLCRIAHEEYKKGGAIHPRILAPSYLIKTQAEREYRQTNER